MRVRNLAPVCAVVLLAIGFSGCTWIKALKARDQLNKGVAAFRNAQFQAAIDHFQVAIRLDPTLLNAKLYLATARFQLYVPGGESPENVKVGEQAIQEFEDVLKDDSNNVNAIGSIATIYYEMHMFDKAKELQKHRLQIEPNNPEGYYWIGQLDWAMCYPRRMGVRKDLKLTYPKDLAKPDVLPPLPEKARAQLAEDNAPLIDEGIQALQKAIELRPDYVDAMAYLNLMYREKAEIEADSSAREADVKQAEELTQKALGIKKQQTERAASAVQ